MSFFELMNLEGFYLAFGKQPAFGAWVKFEHGCWPLCQIQTVWCVVFGHVFKAPRHPTLRDPSWHIQGRPKIFTTETFHGIFVVQPKNNLNLHTLRFLDPWKVLFFLVVTWPSDLYLSSSGPETIYEGNHVSVIYLCNYHPPQKKNTRSIINMFIAGSLSSFDFHCEGGAFLRYSLSRVHQPQLPDPVPAWSKPHQPTPAVFAGSAICSLFGLRWLRSLHWNNQPHGYKGRGQPVLFSMNRMML